MKVLMLNYEFPPLGGGAANANFFLLREFAKKKSLEIDLVTSSVNKFRKEKFSKNITLHRLNIGKNKNNFHYQTNRDLIIYSVKAYLYSRKLVKRNNYDLIHAWFGVPCGFIAFLLGKPYLVALRGSDVPFYNLRFKFLDKLIFKRLSKFIWKKAELVVANSEGLKNLAQKTAPKQKVEIIYNGVDTNFFKPRRSIFKKNVILFVGRLIKRKGINYLLEAFSRISSERRKSWQIYLVGEGPEKNNLKNLTKRLKIVSQVKFLGRKNKKELIEIYNQAKVFALPSLNEGMSNTILEAMACGLPIIATNVGGSEELIKDNGFIVPRANVIAIKEKLKEYLESEKLIRGHSSRSRRFVQEMEWGKVGKKYFLLYKNI